MLVEALNSNQSDLEENWNSVEDPWNTVYGLSRQEQEDDEIACNNDF